jgi:hypothetical protein
MPIDEVLQLGRHVAQLRIAAPAQLAGDIELTHEALRKMVLPRKPRATILQFDPGYRVETIQPKAFRPPKDWANRGEMSRMSLLPNAGDLRHPIVS